MRRILSGVAVVGLASAAALTWITIDRNTSCDTDFRDLAGRCVALDETPERAGIEVQPTGDRFVAPAQGLDVPLLELPLGEGPLNPPTVADAFLVREAGDSRADGTGRRARLVVLHAIRDGRAPGNAFVGRPAAAPEVVIRPGDPLLVGSDVYRVTATEVLDKAAAAAATQIWGVHPDGADRLVVLTCLPRVGHSGPAAENLVVHAVRATAPL